MYDYEDYDGTEPPNTVFKFIVLIIMVVGFMMLIGAIAP